MKNFNKLTYKQQAYLESEWMEKYYNKKKGVDK